MVDQDSDLRDLMRRARAGLSPTDVDLAAAHVRLENALWDVSPSNAPPPRNGSERVRRWAQGATLGLVAGMVLGFYLGNKTSAPGANATPSASTIEASAFTSAASATTALEPRSARAADDERSEDAVMRSVPASEAETPPTSGSREEHTKRRTLGGAEDSAQREGSASGEQTATTTTASGPDEVEFVRRAQRALARKEPTLALGLLKQLDEQLPKGRLLEERYAGKAIARCMLNPSEGPEVQRSFTRRYPQSVHGERVTRVCLGNDVHSAESTGP